ncbi:MAG: carboxylating nicotinate-nucleotide diphosphorylase [Methanobacteriaceae archaeon]|jgi:nicotinate-nucleotide pyrophosphorylase (carboxylating)|nr:carboxylating nicotinate-nucleotide diphosphorylase [Methanobacteriaceae archaeon]
MKKIIDYMLEEDEGFGDITSNFLIDKSKIITATIISKENGIFAGFDIVKKIFEENNIEIISNLDDGFRIDEDDVLIEIIGEARKILLLERTILNLLMRMSGVATYTREIVDEINKINPNCRIAGTRKTSPGISKFDKIAISIGGGDTHRFSLDDMVLIKDNHIAIVGSPVDALKIAKSKVSFSKKIEIEVESLDDAVECAKNGADIIMLDNMSSKEINEVLSKLSKLNIRENVLIEISGGINKDNILDYASLDVDIISLGALTHSSKSLNFSLNVVD